MLSEIRVRPVRSVDRNQEHAEKWLTKKKVEIVTTKNVEKTIKRQLVLEDGRILDEDIPIVTVDTTENKEIFETDQDEERDNLDYNKKSEMNIGDKVTTLKTTKDVKENVTKTEASQNIGSIANRHISGAMSDRNKVSSMLRQNKRSSKDLVVVPVVVQNSRSHKTVTDTERVNQRKYFSGGRMLTENIKTEQHEEYESNDCETSDDESDFEKIEYEELQMEEPAEYKTRTEESFIEYFKMGKGDNTMPSMVLVGERPYYKTDSKQYSKNNSTSSNKTLTPRKPLKQSRSWDNDRENKLGSINNTLSRQFSNSLGDLSKNSHERVFIAKPIEETPAVKLRNKKKNDINKLIEHRRSANYYSSRTENDHSFSRCSTPTSSREYPRTSTPNRERNSTPTRERTSTLTRERTSTPTREYLFPNCRVKKSPRDRPRPMSLDITKLVQDNSQDHSYSHQSSNLGVSRSYHSSSLDISTKPKQIEIKIESPEGYNCTLVPKEHYSSTGNLLSSSGRDKQICTKSLVKKGERFQSVGDICFTTSKEIQNVGREVSVVRNPMANRKDGRKSSGRLVFTSEKPKNHQTKHKALDAPNKTSSCSNLSTRIIPIDIRHRHGPFIHQR